MQEFKNKWETFKKMAPTSLIASYEGQARQTTVSSEALCEGGSFSVVWCRGSELNQRREALQASALPLSYPGIMIKNYESIHVWYLFIGFCQYKGVILIILMKVIYLQYNGFALPAFMALGTGIKSPVKTSKMNPYIAIFDGIKG